jgi:hypothetical protein
MGSCLNKALDIKEQEFVNRAKRSVHVLNNLNMYRISRSVVSVAAGINQSYE